MPADLPPTAADLRRFLLGDLPPAELEAVGRYLDAHPEAALTLPSLTADDTLLAALRGTVPEADPPELSAAVARAEGLLADEPATPPDGAGGTQSFVSPSTDATADPDAPAADEPDDLFAALAAPAAAGELGRLGGYRVLRLLGRGGMGAVFEALDPQLDRRVALKVMLPALAARPGARQRFLREARAAAKIEHDHVVPIYQTGEDRGVPFLAMPLLAGEPLDDRLRGGRALAAGDVLRVGREIADGLAAAHAGGLVHRDIKPSNVWLERTADGAFRRARILDFGLARTAAGEEGLTQSGTVLGTPAYMAPEQARGEHVDARADLFSLGCVLYHAATGRRPFPGTDTFAVLTALATTEPPAAAAVNPAVPAGLSDLITRLLAKDAARRPQTARAVADELARLAAAPATASATLVALPAPADVWSEVGADMTEALEPPRPRRRSNRGAWVAAGLLFVAAAALTATQAPTVIRVVTNRGDLVVEVDDPDIEVTVKQGDVVVFDRVKQREFLLRAGKGEVIFFDKDGAKGATRVFEIARAEKTALRVTSQEMAAAVPRANDQTTPPAAPPSPTAFPGKLVVADDGAAGGRAFPTHAQPKVRREYANGVYLFEDATPDGKDTSSEDVLVGPKLGDQAFALRVKYSGAEFWVDFRRRRDGPSAADLRLALRPDGTWALTRREVKQEGDATPVGPVVPLAASDRADPRLKAGEWVTVAVSSVGRTTKLWLNGVAEAEVTDAADARPAAGGLGVGHTRRGADPARYEVDYLYLWDLGGSAPPSAPLRAAMAWVWAAGGKVGLLGGERVLGSATELPAGAFTVAKIELNGTKVSDADLGRLAPLGAATELILAHTPVGDAGLPALAAALPALRELELPNTAVTDAGLAALGKLPDLERLSLNTTAVDGSGLAKLAGLKRLKVLFLGGTRLTDDALPALHGFAALRAVHVEKTRVTRAGVEKLAAARPDLWIEWSGGVIEPRQPAGPAPLTPDQRQAVEWAVANGWKVRFKTPDGNSVVVTREAKTAIPDGPTRLDTLGCRTETVPVAPEALDALRGLPPVRALHLLQSKWVTDAHLARLAGIDSLARAEEVSIGGTDVTDHGLRALTRFPNLRAVFNTDKHVTGAWLEHAAAVPALDDLRMNLGGHVKLDPEWLAHVRRMRLRALHVTGDAPGLDEVLLPHLAGMTTLRYLHLTVTSVTDAGVAHLGGLTGLQHLLVVSPRVTDGAVDTLVKLRGLHHLSVQGSAVTDAGVRRLAALPRLAALNVSFTNVSGAGLAAAREFPVLQRLTLGSKGAIGDAGLANLAGAHTLRTVMVHALSGFKSEFTEAGVQQAAKLLPDCSFQVPGIEKNIGPIRGGVSMPDTVARAGGRMVVLMDFGNEIVEGVWPLPRKDQLGYSAGIRRIDLGGVRGFGDKQLTAHDQFRTVVFVDGTFDLSGTAVTDVGVKTLAGYPSLAGTVGEFKLSDTALTDDGLAALAVCRRLTALDVRRTKVTRAGVERLAAVLPACRVEWDGGVIAPRP